MRGMTIIINEKMEINSVLPEIKKLFVLFIEI